MWFMWFISSDYFVKALTAHWVGFGPSWTGPVELGRVHPCFSPVSISALQIPTMSSLKWMTWLDVSGWDWAVTFRRFSVCFHLLYIRIQPHLDSTFPKLLWSMAGPLESAWHWAAWHHQTGGPGWGSDTILPYPPAPSDTLIPCDLHRLHSPQMSEAPPSRI